MVTRMIKGCGKLVGGSVGGLPCGDSIETGEYDSVTGIDYVIPIYCEECWGKIKLDKS